MGDFQHKPNTGSLFKNGFKEKETQPDYKGQILITSEMTGHVVDIAAWLNEGKGGKYMSLKVSEPYVKDSDGGQAASKPAHQSNTDEPFNDDLPPF